jgi:uncharacterized membrane protein YdbT with pleckstrin-like domain
VPAPQRATFRGPVVVQASDGGVATAAQARPLATSLAALLTRHILRDGELVLLILKPSLWFIVLAVMRFAAVVLMGVIAAKLWLPHVAAVRAAEVGAFLIAGRVMWAVLQWMGRLYVLTDMRILRLSGIFNVDIFDCPLRKVGQVRLCRSFRERLLRLGSIEITPSDDACPAGDWRTIKRADQVLDTIQATIRRAKQGGTGCMRD